jgi:hypothetical protein
MLPLSKTNCSHKQCGLEGSFLPSLKGQRGAAAGCKVGKCLPSIADEVISRLAEPPNLLNRAIFLPHSHHQASGQQASGIRPAGVSLATTIEPSIESKTVKYHRQLLHSWAQSSRTISSRHIFADVPLI